MSTVIESKPTGNEVQDVSRYGWRDVPKLQADGTTRYERQPLTRYDTLHPQLGDHILEGPMHDLIRWYLASVFRSCLADDESAIVLSDCGVYWGDPKYDHHCPDLTVLTGLDDPKEVRHEDSYSVKKFGQLPRLIVEIVSRNVRENDVKDKLEAYHALKIPLYVILDREKSDFDWKIVPYQYAPNRYLKLPTDDRGRFWIDFLGIWLAVEDQKIVCHDGKTNAVIGDYTEVKRQMEDNRRLAAEANQRAEEANQRAEAEKTRAEEANQRAEAEKTRAEEANQRAEAEKTRAEEARQVRETLEANFKEMAAELERLREQIREQHP